MMEETIQYSCNDCEDGENLIKSYECIHCGNNNGQLLSDKTEDYFSDWSGYYCQVEDEHGNDCAKVLPNDRGDLQEHLKEEHGIEVDLE